MFGRLNEWIDRVNRRVASRGREITIRFDDAAVIVEEKTKGRITGVRTLPWDNIRAVMLYKRDVYTYDLLCAAVTSDSGSSLELNEEMPGWDAFARALHAHLPGAPEWKDWYLKVFAMPAGESLQLYSRVTGPGA